MATGREFINNKVVKIKQYDPNSRYVCCVRCEELDYNNGRHCIKTGQQLNKCMEYDNYECPLGKLVLWIKLKEN